MKKQENNIFIRIASLFMAAFLIAGSLPAVNVQAAEKNVDTSKKGTLTIIHYTADNEVAPGVNTKIYRVASVDENGYYTTVAPFDTETAFPIQNINSIQKQSDWDKCIEPARDYIKANSVTPNASGKSDSKGKTVYTGLELGIYLVVNDSIKIGHYKHEFGDFFVAVPGMEKNSDGTYSYTYDVTASPKRSKVDVTEIKEYALYKRWNDSGYSSKRPSSITVKIYCDGNLYETVTLSADNSWSYKWKYEAGHQWKVSEVSTGKNYTAKVTTEGNGYIFIITNTYNPPSTPETPPTDTPPGDETDPGGDDLPAVLGALRDLPAVLGARRLPQTGQLWWPLPVLLIIGVFFIIKGIRKTASN